MEVFRRSLFAVNLARDTVQLFDDCDSARASCALLVNRNSCMSCVQELGAFIQRHLEADTGVSACLLVHGFESSLDRRKLIQEIQADTSLQHWPLVFDIDSPEFIRTQAGEAADIHGRLGIDSGPALIIWNCEFPEQSAVLKAANLFDDEGSLNPAAKESIVRHLAYRGE